MEVPSPLHLSSALRLSQSHHLPSAASPSPRPPSTTPLRQPSPIKSPPHSLVLSAQPPGQYLLPSLPASSPLQPGSHWEDSRPSQPRPAQEPETAFLWGQPTLKVHWGAVTIPVLAFGGLPSSDLASAIGTPCPKPSHRLYPPPPQEGLKGDPQDEGRRGYPPASKLEALRCSFGRCIKGTSRREVQTGC